MVVDRKTGMLIQSVIDLETEMDIEKGDVKIPALMMSTSVTNVKKVNQSLLENSLFFVYYTENYIVTG